MDEQVTARKVQKPFEQIAKDKLSSTHLVVEGALGELEVLRHCSRGGLTEPIDVVRQACHNKNQQR